MILFKLGFLLILGKQYYGAFAMAQFIQHISFSTKKKLFKKWEVSA